MTAEQNQDANRSDEEKNQKVPDFAALWKRIYFESEDALARSVKEFIASQSFVSLLEQMGSQYMALYKASSQNMDRFFANHPMPTKKDIARVAELVVAVEDKVDRLESETSGNMASLAASLIKLVDFQSALKNELLALRQDVEFIRSKMLLMEGNYEGEAAEEDGTTAKEAPAARKRRSKNTIAMDTNTESPVKEEKKLVGIDKGTPVKEEVIDANGEPSPRRRSGRKNNQG